MTSKFKTILILATLFLGLCVRLYKIDSPIADWHSFRQADTASVTRNFLKNGINLFTPTYHDLSNLQSGLENPQGYRMVEVPIYNVLCLWTYQILHFFKTNIPFDLSSRLTAVIISLANSLLLFFFAKNLSKKFTPAYLTFAVYLFLPFSIYYSRVILPEQLAIFFLLASLLSFRKHLLPSAMLLSLSFLIKPYTGLISFPIFLYFSYQYHRKYPLLLILYAALSITPFMLWRHWIQNFATGIPVSNWLLWTDPNNQHIFWFHGHNLTWLVSLIPFKPYWFRWIFYERITILILGTFGVIPLFLGFAYRDKHLRMINLLGSAGIILYFIVVAGGNVRHDYYQVLIIPFLSITISSGLYYISNYLFASKLFSFFSLVAVSSISLLLGLSQIQGYYTINNPNIIDAGNYVNSTIPQNALVVAPYNGDTAFLYQTQRSGWPIEIYDFDKIKSEHPKNPIYLVSTVNDTYTNNVASHYQTIIKNDKFILIDLSHETNQ